LILTILLLSLVAAFLVVVVSIHAGFRAPRRKELGTPADHGIQYEELHIRTSGGKQLFAWRLPNAPDAATVIVLHGWGGNAELMLPLAIPFHRAGLNVLLIDARGHGGSDSAFFTSLPRFTEDLDHAVEWVKARSGAFNQSIVLLGHSVGAGAALYAASKRRDISAVISIAAFAHPEWMMRRYLARFRLPGWLSGFVLRYVEWVIGQRYEEFAPLNTLCCVACPVLLVHGSNDETVPVSDAVALAECSRENVMELLIVEGAGHDSMEKLESESAHLIDFLHDHGIGTAARRTCAS
jgi:alpha-beta hydrolase superfamily lysophospholipase